MENPYYNFLWDPLVTYIIFRAHQLLVYTVISCSILFLLYFTLSGGDTRSGGDSVITGARCPNTSYPGHLVTTRTGTRYKAEIIKTENSELFYLEMSLNLNEKLTF